MTNNPLLASINSAAKANDAVAALFARIGTKAHPRGFVHTWYRTGLRALKTALAEPQAIAALAEVFATMRRGIEADARSLLRDARSLGQEEAMRQLRFYGIEAAQTSLPIPYQTEQVVVDAILAKLTAQESAATALVLTEAETAQILGDDERAGVVRSGEVAAALAYWAAAWMWDGFSAAAMRDSQGLDFSKQAIAALDNRTTDCCLRVHGQVQPFPKNFHLTGTPRFADELEWAPFHHYCRTSVALYLPVYDNGLTGRMADDAAQVLAERAEGRWIDRDPASAFIDAKNLL